MWRDDTELLMHPKVNFVLNHGALGDVITSLPAIIFARRTHSPDMKMTVWAPSYQLDLLATLLHPYGEFAFRRLEDFPKAEVRKTWDEGPSVINSTVHNAQTRNKVDMVDFGFTTLLDARPENSLQRSYPTEAPLGPRPGIAGGYVVFPVGGTSPNKEFFPQVLGPLIAWTLTRGYKPVIVGSAKSHTAAILPGGEMEPLKVVNHFDELPADLKAGCLDLRDKTTLLQLRDLCGYALAVVGMDGGTLHLAGTTDVPIVYACTHILPVHRGITRNGKANDKVMHVTPRELECAGCQSNWTLAFRHDFRFCAYGDYRCSKELAPEDFISALHALGL